MDRLKTIKHTLMSCVEGQMTHLDSVDTKELGEAIDMIKDLEEAIYYCTITKAMEEGKHEEYPKHYDEEMYNQRMYYGGRSGYSNGGNSSSSDGGSNSGGSGSGSSGRSQYYEREYPYEFKDYREGRSPRSRRTYMEAKETHQDKTSQMRELEKYMQELTQDIVEMVEGSSQEEKQYLSKRISALGTKIAQLND